jgi:DNA-binding NarL/FixJ family response regulator
MPERVLIVDPQPFFCESLGVALSSTDLIVVGWTTDEVEASRVAAALSPDLVLTELDLAAGSGLNLVRKLHDRVRFVVLTRRHEGDVVLDAAAAGAVGCISHDVPLPKLRGLLTSATPGRFVADPDRLIESPHRRTDTARTRGIAPAGERPGQRGDRAAPVSECENRSHARRKHPPQTAGSLAGRGCTDRGVGG